MQIQSKTKRNKHELFCYDYFARSKSNPREYFLDYFSLQGGKLMCPAWVRPDENFVTHGVIKWLLGFG